MEKMQCAGLFYENAYVTFTLIKKTVKLTVRMSHLLKKVLSGKYAGVVCLTVAVIVKAITEIYFFQIMTDKSFQLLAAKNFIEGNGLTINQVFVDNIMNVKYEPLIGWPPGYSVILGPLLLLFKNNFLYAAYCFDLIPVIPFFYYLYRLLSLISIQTWLKNLFILGAGFFFYPFGSRACTDFAALVCLMAGFYYTLEFAINKTKTLSIFYIVISLFMSVLLRYLYLPIIFSIPAGMIVAGIITQKRRWVWSAFVMASVLAVLVFFLLQFQKQHTGDAVYIYPAQKGFYFNQALLAYPFIPGSFFDLQLPANFFSGNTLVSYGTVMLFFKIIGYLALSLSLVLSLTWFKNMKLNFSKNLPVSIFYFLGLCACGTIVTVLFYLSLRYNSIVFRGSGRSWTFVQEFRYYAFCVVFIQLLAFLYLFNDYKRLGKFWKTVAATLAILLCLQFSHGVYFVAKIIITKNDRFYFYETNKKQVDIMATLPLKMKQQFPGNEVIVTASDPTFCNIAGLNNYKTVYNCSFLNNVQAISSNKPLVIVAVLSKRVLKDYSSFINNPEVNLIEVIGNQYFYVANVTAH